MKLKMKMKGKLSKVVPLQVCLVCLLTRPLHYFTTKFKPSVFLEVYLWVVMKELKERTNKCNGNSVDTSLLKNCF